MPKIAIVGLGYVGLPLSLQFAKSGATVLGFDVDQSKTDALNSGRSYIKHIAAADVAAARDKKLFEATTDFTRIKEADAVIICVPTPLNKYREPDLSFVLETGKAIAPHIKKGAVVILESTTYPGTTEGELREVLEKGSGLKAGHDFHLAFSPEREDPGNPDSKVASIPKVVGGLTPACLEAATKIYSLAIERIVPVTSCAAAEATKLTENIFRSVNIALVNELKVIYQRMGIDIWERHPQIGQRQQAEDYLEVQKWARVNTAPGSLFMTDPTHCYGWKDYSARPSWGNYRDWIHSSIVYHADAELFSEGLRRARKLGVDPKVYLDRAKASADLTVHGKSYGDLASALKSAFYSLNAESLRQLAEVENIDYFVFDKESAPKLNIAPQFANASFIVYPAH